VPQLPFQLFDADDHYYEALDAFTRHIEPGFEKRCMQSAELNGKTRLLVGGRVNPLRSPRATSTSSRTSRTRRSASRCATTPSR